MKATLVVVALILSCCFATGAYALPIDRAEMAYVTAHAVGGFEDWTPPAIPSAADLSPDFVTYAEIEYCIGGTPCEEYRSGIFNARSIPWDTSEPFRAWERIPRWEVALYAARALDITDHDLWAYDPPYPPTFTDIEADFMGYHYVEYLKSKGLLSGTTFAPFDLMDRDLAADWLEWATGTYVDPSDLPNRYGNLSLSVTDVATDDFLDYDLTLCDIETPTAAATVSVEAGTWSSDMLVGEWSVLVERLNYYSAEATVWIKDLGNVALDIALAREFDDVSQDTWAYDGIGDCASAGIVFGYPDGSYQPAAPVTRDQMAVYVARALAGNDDSVPAFADTPTFPDVPADHWALKYVEYAVDQGVVGGYADGTYRPAVLVDRGTMAVYIARALVAPLGEAGLADYVPADPRNFPDVPADFWSYKHVEYCAEQGVVNGYGDGTYQPANIVTRDQMAVYIARAFLQ